MRKVPAAGMRRGQGIILQLKLCQTDGTHSELYKAVSPCWNPIHDRMLYCSAAPIHVDHILIAIVATGHATLESKPIAEVRPFPIRQQQGTDERCLLEEYAENFLAVCHTIQDRSVHTILSRVLFRILRENPREQEGRNLLVWHYKEYQLPYRKPQLHQNHSNAHLQALVLEAEKVQRLDSVQTSPPCLLSQYLLQSPSIFDIQKLLNNEGSFEGLATA